MKLIREMVELHDEPVATAAWLSHYILVNQVKDSGYDALFGGLGGDELNEVSMSVSFVYSPTSSLRPKIF